MTVNELDRLYAGVDDDDGAVQEAPAGQVRDWEIQHDDARGTKRKKPKASDAAEDLIAETSHGDFTAREALAMLHERWSVDYGRRRSGSAPASADHHAFLPVFYLDMFSIVGRPMRAITSEGTFRANVTFTLRHWQAPYESKHAASCIPFDLTNRTFQLGRASTREVWFVVMHPKHPEGRRHDGDDGSDDDADGDAPRRRNTRDVRANSALRTHHAEALAGYIKKVFRHGDLLGEGVEESWQLGGQDWKNMCLAKWSVFQRVFMERWQQFVGDCDEDGFF
ncbi:hypothetical protein K4F52_010393, partial [Lecanicillium sp. MT-2017a]